MESSQEYFDFFGTQKIESLHKKQRKPNLYFGSVISSPFHFCFHAFPEKKEKRVETCKSQTRKERRGRTDSKQCKGKESFSICYTLCFPFSPWFSLSVLFRRVTPKKPKSPYALGFPKMKTRKGTFFSGSCTPFAS